MTKYLSVGGQAEIAVHESIMPDKTDGIIWRLASNGILTPINTSAVPLRPSPRLLAEIQRALSENELPVWLEFEEAELTKVETFGPVNEKGRVQPKNPDIGWHRAMAVASLTKPPVKKNAGRKIRVLCIGINADDLEADALMKAREFFGDNVKLCVVRDWTAYRNSERDFNAGITVEVVDDKPRIEDAKKD